MLFKSTLFYKKGNYKYCLNLQLIKMAIGNLKSINKSEFVSFKVVKRT